MIPSFHARAEVRNPSVPFVLADAPVSVLLDANDIVQFGARWMEQNLTGTRAHSD